MATWLARRREASQKSQEAYTVMRADQWLATLARALREGQELPPEHASRIWNGMAEVGKALRKAGHARPGQRRSGR